MTANELADLLEQGAYPVGTRHQAATVLRQQSNRIAELEKENADMNRRLLGWDIYEQ